MLKPDLINSQGPQWKLETIAKIIANEVISENGTYFTRNAKMISTDYEKASEITEEAWKMFSKNVDKLKQTTTQIQHDIKKVSGDIRKASDDLSQGLIKVEKTANFNNLEKYVLLLERAASAMAQLAELEKSGKLEKIAGALK
jgi:flagellar capping protein FliD